MESELKNESAFPWYKKTGRALQVERTLGTKARRQKNACNSRCGKVITQQKNLKKMVENTFDLNDKLTAR